MPVSQARMDEADRAIREFSNISLADFLDILFADTAGLRDVDDLSISPTGNLLTIQVRGLVEGEEAPWILPLSFELRNGFAMDRSVHIRKAVDDPQSGAILLRNMARACAVFRIKILKARVNLHRAPPYAAAGFLPLEETWPIIHRHFIQKFKDISKQWDASVSFAIGKILKKTDRYLIRDLTIINNIGEPQTVGAIYRDECKQFLASTDWPGEVHFDDPETLRRYKLTTGF